MRRALAVVLPMLLAAFAALLGGPRPAWAGPDDLIAVPEVAGKTLEEAGPALTSAGFLVSTYEVEGVPVGSIAAQTPAANALAPRGSVVLLDVRVKASDPTPAPKATGLSTADASTAFGALYDLVFQPVPGAESDRGKVVAQAPAMGEPLALRGRLTLSFVPDATLPPSVPVPDATRLSPSDAIQAIAAAGLHARVSRVVVPGTPPDVVVAQLPLPGTETERYTTVDLVVTAPGDGGPAPTAPTVTVPNVVSMTEAAARAALGAAGLDPVVEWVDGDPSRAFLVVSQDPAADQVVSPDASVKLQIVRYTPPQPVEPPPPSKVSVPELVGLQQQQAEALLGSIGLVANPIHQPMGSVPPLQVFAQQLVPGTLVDVGTAIAFRVAQPPPPPMPTPVPNFFGATKGGALAMAAQAGLSISVVEVVTVAHPPHRIYSQSLAAFLVVPPGTNVVVKLARPPAGPPLVEVPDLTGKSVVQANAMLAAASLAGSAIEVVTIAHPPFKVYAQDIAATTKVPVGSTVTFKVAKPPVAWKQVPDLNGKTKAQALFALAAAGLSGAAVDVFAPGKPVGKVFWQDRAANTLAQPGTVVTFKVAKPLLVVVPVLVGKTTAQAIAMLNGLGLDPDLKVVPAPGKPPGLVFDQTPIAGVSVQSGSTVVIRVPMGLGIPVEVPNLVNKTKDQAVALLNAKGLQSDLDWVVDITKAPGTVVGQLPAAGQFVAPNATIQVRVAKAPFPQPVAVMVPNVVGFSQAAATAALVAKGLVADVELVSTFAHAPGKVYDQAPASPVFVAKGSAVKIRVAKSPIGGILRPMPNLIGLTPLQAKNALLAAGFGSTGTMLVAIGKPHGLVYWQEHAFGAMVAKGSNISWRWNP